MVYVSIPIFKWEQDEDGDLVVKGVATDGTVDSDSQIVDPEWSAKALGDWIATGGNVRQSHDPHRPVGKGLKIEVNKDNSGKHWVTSVIVDQAAQRLVKKGVLTAYSVGISRPVIKHDPSGKARGGIIVGGELAELSIVDRPSNKSSYLELAKAAASGECEFIGKVHEGPDEVEKQVSATDKISPTDISSFTADEALFSFTPNDMAKIMKEKIIQQHYKDLAADAVSYDPFRYSAADKRDFDRGVGGGVDRDRLADSDFAGPHRSFPIVNQSDVSDALHLVGHADDPAAVRARIHEIARRKGFNVPDDNNKEDLPDVVKDPPVGQSGDAASASPGKELSSPESMDADGDCDGDGIATDGIPKAAKPPKPKGKKGKKLPPWLNQSDGDASAEPAEKCGPDPKTASGAEEPADMETAPLPSLLESPAPSHMKSEQVALRYKTVGIDFDLGVLHDMTCPAFSPAEVAAYHPFASFKTAVNETVWQQKALNAAAGRSIDEAIAAQQAWQAAALLKASDASLLDGFRLELYKAFRDANPGVANFPTPGTIGPKQFNRPCITDGHATYSPGYGPPNSSVNVATSAPNAHSFNRPPLSSGQQSPSPSFMKTSWPYPDQQGVPSRLDYPEMEKEKARRALSMMHDHLIHMFPSVCPIIDQDAYRIEQQVPAPTAVGLGKAEKAEELPDIWKYIRKLEKRVQSGEISGEQARAKLSKRITEDRAESLRKQVDKGQSSIEEIAKALGITKAEGPSKVVEKAAELSKTAAAEPELLKSMMSEILQPFQQQIEALTKQNVEYRQVLDSQNQALDAQKTELKNAKDRLDEDAKRWEALADSADPSTTSFAGLALRKTAPAGIVKQAEVSERVQGMMMRQLERTWRTSENPAEREAAYAALNRMKNNEV